MRLRISDFEDHLRECRARPRAEGVESAIRDLLTDGKGIRRIANREELDPRNHAREPILDVIEQSRGEEPRGTLVN